MCEHLPSSCEFPGCPPGLCWRERRTSLCVTGKMKIDAARAFDDRLDLLG